MADNPETGSQHGDAQSERIEPTPSSKAEYLTPMGEEQEGHAGSAQDRRERRQHSPLSLLRHLTVNEWLTFFVGLGTLFVSALALITASDTRDLKGAIANLSALATQAQRQADAQAAQVSLLREQLKIGQEQAAGTGMLIGAANRSADAAGAQVETIRSEQRPWVSVSDPVVGEESPSQQRWLRMQIAATGNRPARGVSVMSALAPGNVDALKAQSTVCNGQRPPRMSEGVMFPGEKRTVIVADVSVVAMAQLQPIDFSGYLVGCVRYADADGGAHQTGFIYDLMEADALGPGRAGPINTQSSLRTPRIMLQPHRAGVGRID